jgi:asparagine synthase (glutamine-hydrolysing)
MCGIAGVIGYNSSSIVNKMLDAMPHRGPDDRGFFADENISLGMNRLAIIDVHLGHQPMFNDDKNICVVFNGEIYNFREEKQKLEQNNVVFYTQSDTEVLLKMYEFYGDKFLNLLRGMFALCIYDIRKGRNYPKILLARDQFGIKPLLYAPIDGGIIFASELKGILASGLVDNSVNPDALRMLLTYSSIQQPQTILKSPQMILPAHKLLWENGKYTLSKYWHLCNTINPEIALLPYSEQLSLVEHTLSESIRLQMYSSVPIGAFLSGGIDSSLLVGLMNKYSSGNVNTFSIGFGEEGKDIDESYDAEKIARHLGTNHHKITITEHNIKNEIYKIIDALDQPSVDGVNTYFVSQAAKEFVTVAISGTGGDELFAGYRWFIEMALYEKEIKKNIGYQIQKYYSDFLRKDIFNLLSLNPYFYKYIDDYRSFGTLAQFSRFNHIFSPKQTSKLLHHSIKDSCYVGRDPSIDFKNADQLLDGTIIQRISALCLHGYTQNQLLRDIDAVSMKHSLEVRVPFLDTEVASVALSLPDSSKLEYWHKMKRGTFPLYQESGAKKIMFDIAKKYLPSNIDKQKKRGFGMPFNSWLKSSLYDILQDSFSETNIKKVGWFEYKEVQRYLLLFNQDQCPWYQIWLLLIIQLWALQTLKQ